MPLVRVRAQTCTPSLSRCYSIHPFPPDTSREQACAVAGITTSTYAHREKGGGGRGGGACC